MAPLHEAADDAPVVIKVDRVSKHFTLRRDNSLKDRLLSFRAGRQNREDFTALNDISLEVKAGHTVALIGHNGSGKSTLLKIIGGILDPSAGMISRRGRVAALLELGAGFHPDLSGRDNVFLNASLLGMTRSETEAVFDQIVAFAELESFIDTQVKFYSSGMYVRLAFAVAVHADPDLLLVDEVLAVGDEAFQRKCMDVIRRFQSEGRTIVLVTHNLGQVLDLADRAVLLHHGSLIFQGDPGEAVVQFRDLLEENRLERLDSDQSKEVEEESPLARIISAEVRSPHRDNAENFELGDDLEIDMVFHCEEPLTSWICGVQIDNVHGNKVIGTGNNITRETLPPLEGEVQVTLRVISPQFATGKYFVNVSLLDSTGRHLHDRPQIASFNAVAPSNATGVVWAETSFSLGRNS